MPDKNINKITLFTIAEGKDPVYFLSVRQYFPFYNKENFGQDEAMDYSLLVEYRDIRLIYNNLWLSLTLSGFNLLMKTEEDKEEGLFAIQNQFFVEREGNIKHTYNFRRNILSNR